MSVTYTCPGCTSKLKAPKRFPPGKVVTCPNCEEKFKPEGEGEGEAPAAAATLKFADDEPKKAAPAKPGAKPAPKKEEPAAPAAAAPAGKKPFADDDDESAESIKKGYGVEQDTEEDKEKAKKNKPSFNEVADKFKKSARGPAQGLLVMPSNLLIGEGLLTILGGILMFVVGMWPLVFNDAPPGEEELDEAVIFMLMGCVTFGWGAMVCWGASHMQELGSYPWAMVGAVMGIFPLLVGIFAIILLQNPKVKAGFDESAGGPDDDEEDEDGKDKDEDEDEDEDEDDEEDEESAAAKTAKKVAKRLGKGLLGKLTGGGGDDEDE